MLRLTIIECDGPLVTLRVEGRIVAEWSGFLETECLTLLARTPRLRIDLADVSYIDRGGAAMLRRLPHHRCEIANCPPLIGELHQQDGQP